MAKTKSLTPSCTRGCNSRTVLKEIFNGGGKDFCYVCPECSLIVHWLTKYELSLLGPWDPEEYAAEQEIQTMDPDQLDTVPYRKRKWHCSIEGCTNGTHVRDYGFTVNPYILYTRWGWMNLSGYVYRCGKHYKAEKAGAELDYKEGSGHEHLSD